MVGGKEPRVFRRVDRVVEQADQLVPRPAPAVVDHAAGPRFSRRPVSSREQTRQNHDRYDEPERQHAYDRQSDHSRNRGTGFAPRRPSTNGCDVITTRRLGTDVHIRHRCCYRRRQQNRRRRETTSGLLIRSCGQLPVYQLTFTYIVRENV